MSSEQRLGMNFGEMEVLQSGVQKSQTDFQNEVDGVKGAVNVVRGIWTGAAQAQADEKAIELDRASTLVSDAIAEYAVLIRQAKETMQSTEDLIARSFSRQ